MHQGPPESPRNDNIDPAIAGSSYEPSGGDSGGDDAEGKKDGGAKRELSTSKRAAQNRAAQVCLPCFLFLHPEISTMMNENESRIIENEVGRLSLDD